MPTQRNVARAAGFIADLGGRLRFGNVALRRESGMGSPGKNGATAGLVIHSGITSPSLLARPITALRV